MPTRILILLLGAMATGGCFTYEALETPSPEAGTAVRAYLSAPQDVPLSDRTLHGIIRVDGEIVESSARSVVLAATRFQSGGGLEQTVYGNTVVLLRDDLETLEGKRFHLARSAAFAGATVAFLFLVNEMMESLGGQPEDGSSNGPPNPR